MRQDEQTGRLLSAMTNAQLELVVRAIALHVTRDDPASTSRPAFDAERTEPQWPKGIPSAASIARRWKMPWTEALDTMFDETRDLHHRISSRGRIAPIAAPVIEDVVFSLQLIAARLGVDTLRPAQYEAECRALRVQVGEKWLHGGERGHLLPTVDQIEQNHGWDAALEAAGLRRREGTTHVPDGTSPSAAIELFVREVGCLPWAVAVLRQFMKDRVLSLANSPSYTADVADYVAARARDGRAPAPQATPARRLEPLPPAPEVLPDVPGLVAGRRRLRPEEIVPGIRRAQDRAHREHVRLTQKVWRQYAREDDRVPYPRRADSYAREQGTTVAALLEQASSLPKASE